MRNKFLEKIMEVHPNKKLMNDILIEYEKEVQEQFVIRLLIEKRNKKINSKCWNTNGCVFSTDESRYMKCWQENYSVDQCKQDNF